MLNDIDATVLTWHLARGASAPNRLFVYRADALGQPTGRAETILQRIEGGVAVHDADAIGNPNPRPRQRVLRQGEGWGLFAVDPLGRNYRIRDLVWKSGADGLELAEADARGAAEARPLGVLLSGARTAFYPIDVAGGRPAFPLHELREDPRSGWTLLHELNAAGEVHPRPLRVLVGRG